MNEQYRLADVCRELGCQYHWLNYQLRKGKPPVPKLVAYTPDQLKKLKDWYASVSK